METALAVSQTKYWHLKQMGMFKSLADWELKQLVNIADLRLFKRGEDVFRAGDLWDHFYVLRTGTVKLYREIACGKQIIFGFEGPGVMFGETALIVANRRRDNARIVDGAFTCVIERNRFAGYLAQHPDLSGWVTAVIAKRKEAIEDRMIALLSEDVRARLAHALVRLANECGEPDDRGLRIGLRLTQTDLGQLVGSTRETTSMAFNGFRREGLVESSDLGARPGSSGSSLRLASSLHFHHGLLRSAVAARTAR